jgi:hypothetical protein
VPRPRKPRRLKFHVYRGPAGQLPTVPPGELLLEYFSDEEIVAWHAQGENIQRYHYLWWFELESQRALHQPAMIDALASIVGITIELRHWGRAIQYKYANFPLSCVGSLKWVGGRFNYGVDIDSSRFAPFPALYLAEDMETGLREMQGLTREGERAGLTADDLNLCAANGVAWVAVDGTVSNIFDLTHPKGLESLAEIIAKFSVSKAVREAERRLGAIPLRLIKSAKELFESFMVEHWREFPTVRNTPSNSQLFGHLLSLAGFEGALFSSTRTGKKNLVLFPRKFEHSNSRVIVRNPPAKARCTELSSATFLECERLD